MARDRKLIVDELLTTPSGVSPMLFVGLGGAGCRMVKRVAEHLRRRPDFRERYSDLVKFAMVDTNVNDLESYRNLADATFLISDFEKEEYANLASGKKFLEADEYFTQWVPADYRFRSGDTAGAGQIRIEARLGVYYQMKHKDFVPRFRNLLEQLKSHEHGHRRLDSDEIRIVLCYSIAGGTGSGCHLPVSYMLREQASQLGRPTMIGVAVLPAVFEDKVGVNKDGTFANGYAALKETEHLMKLGAPDSRFFPKDGEAFHYNPANPSKVRVYERPFDFLYLIDKPESFSVPEPVDAAADGLYLQFFSPLYGAQLSDYDNYTQYQRFLVPDDFEERGIAGFSTFYGSFGCAVLLVPVPGLIEYCSQAAALALIRASFMGEIPADAIYAPLRQDRANFDEVAKSDDEDAQIYRASEIPDQPQKADRNRLYDRLFTKRVRLLAACEYRENKAGRFQEIFRHGHYLGSEPNLDGTASFDPEIHGEAMRQEQRLVEGRISGSIGGIVLPLLQGMPGEDPSLLDQAHQAIKRHNPAPIRTSIRVVELKRRADSWREELRREGLRRLREGFSEGTVRMPGMERLVNLEFLRRDAAEVDLIAKRYAVLSLLEKVDFDQTPDEGRASNFDVQDKKPGTKLKPDDELIEHVLSQARDLAFHDVRREFLSQLGVLREALQGYADEMRELERGSINLEREYSRLLERLQTQGEDSANQYILDAEALQGEDNRRFWDFYFEDKIADLPELSLTSERVQQILSDTVVDLSQRRGRSTSTTRLEQLFTALRLYAHEVLVKRIGGDPHSPDRELRDGLTLSDALELEIVYRALYRSHSEIIKGEGERKIRQVLSEYRALPEEKQIDFGDLKHQKYLSDKIKRVVKEKASVLCVYDKGQDQHGGVRPDHVFLAAIDENFKNSNIERALRNADIADLDWVSGNWHNAKEVVFYRSVLNVPLYAFGRLDMMKHHYDTFRRQARRSKALHIDKNWEGSVLCDLDPNVLKEQHRQVVVRDRIIDFTALLCMAHPRLLGKANCLIRRRGRYLLLEPSLQALPEDHDGGYHDLGDTLAQAIEQLPQILESKRVKFGEYRDSLYGVRNGAAPELLVRISHLPIDWRQEFEDLSNHYGPDRTLEQKRILEDLQDSYQRLHEALVKLLAELRNRQLESRSRKEDLRIYTQDPAIADGQEDTSRENTDQESLSQSIRVLAVFSERWSKLEDPGEVPEAPRSFKSLFNPLSAEDLQTMLEGLRYDHRNGDEPNSPSTNPAKKRPKKDSSPATQTP